MADIIPLKFLKTGGAVLAPSELNPGDTIPNVYLSAQPPTLYGTYAARPVATSVPSGTIYYSTDTRECHRVVSGAWAITGFAGNEIGLAESTTVFSTTSTTPVDVPGLTMTIKVGERPILATFGASVVATGGAAVTLALVVNGVKRSQVVYAGTTYLYLTRTCRIGDLAAGSNPTLKLQLSTSAGTATIYGDSGDRPSIEVVNA